MLCVKTRNYNNCSIEFLLITELFRGKLIVVALVEHHPIGGSLLGFSRLEVVRYVNAVQ